MANSTYMSNRLKYFRPQAMVWSDAYQSSSGIYIPSGVEYEDFIILSDHNRSPIEVSTERIENRKRMINGNMRSYHVADKRRFSLSWDMLPSRAFNNDPLFDSNGISSSSASLLDYVVDNGAGGVEILNWYENHNQAFYILLSYDKYNNFSTSRYNHLNEYVDVAQVFFSSFNFSIEKRGNSTYDFWNISVELEEV